jgi:hypothetical protein
MKRLSLVASLALSLSSLISTSLVNARTPTIATSNRLAKHDSASEKQQQQQQQQQHTDSKSSEPTHSLVTTNRDHSIRRLKVDTAAGCFLDVSLTCTPKNNEAASCDDLFASAKASMCDFPATGFEFLFSGGNCDNSINVSSRINPQHSSCSYIINPTPLSSPQLFAQTDGIQIPLPLPRLQRWPNLGQ